MIYLMTGSIHSHLNKEQRMAGFARRAEWKYPASAKVIGEYWAAKSPQITTIFEADSYDPILAIAIEWGDFMEIEVAPATTPEAGLAAAAKLLSGK